VGNAQLVAIGFAVAFSATGIGAPVGFLIGSIVGNMLFPPSPLQSEGPRLGDLQVTSSSFGAPRAIGRGTVRQGGNVIWFKGGKIDEKKRTDTISGGKGSMTGSPDTKQTTYSYFGTWAQAFGEGPANDVLRIWADGKIVFDKRSTTTATQKPGFNFRFYPGSETQQVDPAIEAEKGVGNAPAFRGTVMIVFDNIPLRDYGNRLPNITAEIAYDATDAKLSEESTDLPGTQTTQWATNVIGVDWDRGHVFAVDALGANPEDTWLRKFRLSDLQEIDQRNGLDALIQTDDTKFKSSGVGFSVLPNGDLITMVDEFPGGTNQEPIVLIDPYSLTEKARFGVGSANTKYLATGFAQTDQFAPISMFTLTGKKDFVLCGSTFNSGSAGVLEVTGQGLGYVYSTDGPAGAKTGLGKKVYSVCPGKVGEGEGTGFYVTAQVFGAPNSTTIDIHKVTIKANASLDLTGALQIETGGEDEIIRSFAPSDLFAGATNWNDAPYIVYDASDDTLILSATRDSPIEERVFKINTDDGSILWTASEATNAGVKSNDTRFGNNSRLRGGTWGYIVGNNGFQINTVTGEVLHNNDAPDYAEDLSGFAMGAYDSITETYIGPNIGTASTPVVRFFFNRKTDAGISVGQIVKDLAERVGLDPAVDLDTTDIDATTTPGYLIGRQTNARAAIGTLARTYFFDGFESDDKLKFKLRGAAAVRSITESEFVPLNNQNQTIKESRTQEVELPERFSLLYLDKDNDYLQNAHNAKRVKSPFPAMKSDNELGLDYPGALTATFAKQQAEKSLYTAWTERSQFSFRVPWTHLDLDPSDVVTLSLNNGQNLRARLVQADIGVDYSIEMVAIGEETNQFVSSVLGDAGSGVPTQIIPISFFVETIILDSPLFRDQDEIASRAGNNLYVAMGSAQEGAFTAGILYKSIDAGASYTEEKSFVSEMNWGTTLNALAAPLSPWLTDTVNTLTVSMVSGASALQSITQAQLLDDLNTAAILKNNGEIEIIGFQDVTVNADGTLTLSTLLRGKRGTETMIPGHTVGEKFLFMDPVDIELVTLGLAERNAARTYKSVGGGQIFENGQEQVLTSLHRALMPYHPAQPKMVDGASSSTDFTWERRTRVGGEIFDDVPLVPLSEDTEEYELEIFDGPGGSIVRTVTGLTTPAYNYSSANQTTDGFTPPIQTATIKLYQISAQVGRGFSEEVTISVN
jgi:hypothetical protein